VIQSLGERIAVRRSYPNKGRNTVDAFWDMNASSGPMEGALLKGESLKWCHGLALTLSHPFGTI
jgi:hypothetical protein